jgi:hypothetical protein
MSPRSGARHLARRATSGEGRTGRDVHSVGGTPAHKTPGGVNLCLDLHRLGRAPIHRRVYFGLPRTYI